MPWNNNGIFCDLAGTRTLGPLIKSQLLYQLSYEVGITVCKSKENISELF